MLSLKSSLSAIEESNRYQNTEVIYQHRLLSAIESELPGRVFSLSVITVIIGHRGIWTSTRSLVCLFNVSLSAIEESELNSNRSSVRWPVIIGHEESELLEVRICAARGWVIIGHRGIWTWFYLLSSNLIIKSLSAIEESERGKDTVLPVDVEVIIGHEESNLLHPARQYLLNPSLSAIEGIWTRQLICGRKSTCVIIVGIWTRLFLLHSPAKPCHYRP